MPNIYHRNLLQKSHLKQSRACIYVNVYLVMYALVSATWNRPTIKSIFNSKDGSDCLVLVFINFIDTYIYLYISIYNI